MLAKMCRENGKYVVEFKLMQELALESVLFFLVDVHWFG